MRTKPKSPTSVRPGAEAGKRRVGKDEGSNNMGYPRPRPGRSGDLRPIQTEFPALRQAIRDAAARGRRRRLYHSLRGAPCRHAD